MFECMKIAESIYESVVETSYKKTTRADDNHVGHKRKMRGETALSNTYSDMSESASKRRKIYVDHQKNELKPTCLLHDPGHSSDQ